MSSSYNMLHGRCDMFGASSINCFYKQVTREWCQEWLIIVYIGGPFAAIRWFNFNLENYKLLKVKESKHIKASDLIEAKTIARTRTKRFHDLIMHPINNSIFLPNQDVSFNSHTCGGYAVIVRGGLMGATDISLYRQVAWLLPCICDITAI